MGGKVSNSPDMLPRHVNIFGTGGDCSNDSSNNSFGKTLNISSLAATIASQKIAVIKVGTRGVTAKWGSGDFFERLAKLATEEAFPFAFKPPSRFISLKEFGFHYSDNIISARRRIFTESRLDIFKVVFPFANLTHSYGQVNGISRPEYIEFFFYLASERPNSRILLVHNENGHDELFPGGNKLIFHYHGRVSTVNLTIERMPQDVESIFRERETLDEQILAAKYLLENPHAREPFLDILCYNAATIVALDFWQEFSEILIPKLAQNLKQEFLTNHELSPRNAIFN